MKNIRFRTWALVGAIAAISGQAATMAASGAAAVTRADGQSEPAQRAIRWETSLEAARARARRTGKPLLLLHLFGRLDQEFC